MTKRLPILLSVLALSAAACGSIPEGEVVHGDGERFVPFVAEFLDDSGLGSAVAVDAEGVPSVSYWIFPAELEEGEIPVGRPIGAPYIVTDDAEPQEGAAIGVASLSAENVFTRGAAAQVRETPQGVVIPYGPAFEPSLVGATAANTNGTDIAIVDDATHVVWTAHNGVFYAGGPDPFAVERVEDYGFSLRRAGPLGRAAVTADADGDPWVAYTASTAAQEVRVATRDGDRWTTETVATIPKCSACPPPQPTGIGVTSDGPMVAWVDTDAGAVVASTLEGDEWVSTEVAAGGSGLGLDMAVDPDGNAVLTYYDAEGGVQLARQTGASWSVSTIAEASPADPEAVGNLAPTTGVAIDDEGGLVVAWDDADGVVAATSEDGEEFTPIESPDTLGGRSPAVGVSPDGARVYVSWYDPTSQNLRFGVLGDVGELAVAAPSPTADPGEAPAPAPEPGGGGECGADGEIALDIVALGVAWDTSCLVAPAGEPFTVNVDNQDDGIPHNFALSTEEGGELIGATEVEPGIVQQTLDVDPLDAGEYFYICDVHPNMTGTLAAVEAGGGGGGGGGNA